MPSRRSAALATALSIILVVLVVSSANVAVVDSEPDIRCAYVLLQEGQLHLWAGNNPEQALNNFERIINDYPASKDVPTARLRKMIVLEKLGRAEEALKCGAEMITDYPGQTIAAWAQAQAGHVYMVMGDKASAERELLKVEQQYGKLPDKGPLDQSRRDLGRIYLAAKKAAEDAAVQQPLIDGPSSDPPTATADDVASEPSDGDPAVETLEEVAEVDQPIDPRVEAHKTACMAAACASDGDLATALTLYNELKATYPEAAEYIVWVAYEIASKLEEQGPVKSKEEHLRLLELLRTPETLVPQDSFHVIKSALLYYRYCTINGIYSGGEFYRRHDIAAEALERVATSYPDNSLMPEVLGRLASCYQSLSQYDRALEAFNRIISEYPHQERWFVEALASAASIYQRKSDQQKAVDYLERLIASTRDLVMVRCAMDELEKIYTQSGNGERAYEILIEHVQLLEWSLTDPGVYFEQSLRNRWEADLTGLKVRLAQWASSDSDDYNLDM